MVTMLITSGVQPPSLQAQDAPGAPRFRTLQLIGHGLFYDYLGFQYEVPIRSILESTQVWQVGFIGLGDRIRPGYQSGGKRRVRVNDPSAASFSELIWGRKKTRELGGFLRWGLRYYPFRSNPGQFGVFLQPEVGVTYAYSKGAHRYNLSGNQQSEYYAYQFRFHQIAVFAVMNVGAQFRWRRIVWGGSVGLGFNHARTKRILTGTYPWYVHSYFGPGGNESGRNPSRRYTHRHIYLGENDFLAFAATYSVTVGWLLMPRDGDR